MSKLGYLRQAYSADRVTDTQFCGEYCTHYLVHKGDETGNWGSTPDKPKLRTQDSSKFLFKKGKAHVIEFSLCFPSIQPQATYMDLHSQDGSPSPFYIVGNEEDLIFRFNGHGKNKQVLIPRHWYHFTIETNLHNYFRLHNQDGLLFEDTPIYTPPTVNFKIGPYEYANNWVGNPTREVYAIS